MNSHTASHNSSVIIVDKERLSKNQFRKHIKRIKKQKISIVFNYSRIVLTDAMVSVLNRGLNFCILPMKLDITQVLVDWKQFERSMIWTEFWYGKEKVETKTKVFKNKKNNLPKNHRTPEELKVYLEAAKWDIISRDNRNKAECNLPPEEMKALKELVQLQKDCKITIKPCDKGAGIIILEFEEYIRACNKHLESKQKQNNGDFLPYYTIANQCTVQEAKVKIKNLLEEGYNNNIINKEEYEEMDPEKKHPSNFYCTFKVHKPHVEGTASPERPIISGSGSLTENPSLFIEHHIKDLANQHPSYLQDTPHFLREIQTINEGGKLSENAMLVTMDVTALFTNTPQDESAQSVGEALSEEAHVKHHHSS